MCIFSHNSCNPLNKSDCLHKFLVMLRCISNIVSNFPIQYLCVRFIWKSNYIIILNLYVVHLWYFIELFIGRIMCIANIWTMRIKPIAAMKFIVKQCFIWFFFCHAQLMVLFYHFKYFSAHSATSLLATQHSSERGTWFNFRLWLCSFVSKQRGKHGTYGRMCSYLLSRAPTTGVC